LDLIHKSFPDPDDIRLIFLSGAIYTKGFELKDKLQLIYHGIAFSGASVYISIRAGSYWTCNNTFSLLKIYFLKKMKHPQEVFLSGYRRFIGTVLMCVFYFYNIDKMLWHFIALAYIIDIL
jgi:hypothetical protein